MSFFAGIWYEPGPGESFLFYLPQSYLPIMPKAGFFYGFMGALGAGGGVFYCLFFSRISLPILDRRRDTSMRETWRE